MGAKPRDRDMQGGVETVGGDGSASETGSVTKNNGKQKWIPISVP